MILSLQKAVSSRIGKILGDEAALEEYKYPLHDAGLFGPGTPVWRVHSDLPSMLIGGISSLMLQSLHPLPMAAVADHSSYKEDPFGRFQRTVAFVAGTTFGSTEMANGLIDRVKSIHDKISGTSPKYGGYRASDPNLLTFVHTAEVSSFLRAYQRFSLNPLTKDETDLYYREVSLVAELLGAQAVPKSSSEVKAYFAGIRKDLCATEEAKEALEFLRNGLPDRITGGVVSGSTETKKRSRSGPAGELTYFSSVVFTEAAYELLFYWAKDLFGAKEKIKPSFVVPSALLACSALRHLVGPSKAQKIALQRSSGILADDNPGHLL